MKVIGLFPGIDKLLQTADAVVVARILEHYPSPETIRINDWSEYYSCRIEQSLKGELRPSSQHLLRIEDNSFAFPRILPVDTVEILFLRKHPKDKQGAEYDSLDYEGGNIKIAPFGIESVPQTGTSKQRIKALLQHYRKYRAKELQKEEDFLQKALRS